MDENANINDDDHDFTCMGNRDRFRHNKSLKSVCFN